MKKFVITIMDMKDSVKMAERCIKSGINNDIKDIQMFPAITPKNNPLEIMKNEGLPGVLFQEKFSNFDNVISCFLSHYLLWKKCVLINESIMILEHDAEFMLPVYLNEGTYKGCISIGSPSYGKFITPKHFGVNPLTSKPYFPGAHAYIVTPEAAKKLIDKAKLCAAPTDVFLCKRNFDFLEELYPWPVRANDEFTTVQNELGCKAKHNYKNNKEFKIKHAK